METWLFWKQLKCCSSVGKFFAHFWPNYQSLWPSKLTILLFLVLVEATNYSKRVTANSCWWLAVAYVGLPMLKIHPWRQKLGSVFVEFSHLYLCNARLRFRCNRRNLANTKYHTRPYRTMSHQGTFMAIKCSVDIVDIAHGDFNVKHEANLWNSDHMHLCVRTTWAH